MKTKEEFIKETHILIEECKNKILNILFEVEDKPKVEMWKPNGEKYHYIDEYGEVCLATVHNSEAQKDRYLFGNVINPMEKVSQKIADRRRVLQKIERLASVVNGEWEKPVNGETCGYIDYDQENNTLHVTYCIFQRPIGTTLFKSKEDAQSVLDSLTDEDKKVLEGMYS